MPKETFFNLPNEKRANITNIAIEEFANNDYAEVSISRLVARAGIAKGSFYHYFEDKEDLYAYLLDLAARKKSEMCSSEQSDPGHVGIFCYLCWMVQASVQFELAYPELSRLGYRAQHREIFAQTVDSRVQQNTRTSYKRLVVQGKEQGVISPEIDDDLAAFVLDVVFSGLVSYLLQRVIVVRDNGWQGSLSIFELPEVARLLDQVLDVLEHGLGGRPNC